MPAKRSLDHVPVGRMGDAERDVGTHRRVPGRPRRRHDHRHDRAGRRRCRLPPLRADGEVVMTDKGVFVLTRDPDVDVRTVRVRPAAQAGPGARRARSPAISTVALTLQRRRDRRADRRRRRQPSILRKRWSRCGPRDRCRGSGVPSGCARSRRRCRRGASARPPSGTTASRVPVGRAPWTGMLMFGERLAGDDAGALRGELGCARSQRGARRGAPGHEAGRASARTSHRRDRSGSTARTASSRRSPTTTGRSPGTPRCTR